MSNPKRNSIQIECYSSGLYKHYTSIGYVLDNNDGYFDLWPKKNLANLNEWLVVFNSLDIINQIYFIGSIARTDSNQFLSEKIVSIKLNNFSYFEEFTNHYFEEFQDGLLIKQDGLFLDLVFGEYAQLEEIVKEYENEEEEAYDYDYKKHFVNGDILHILDKSTTWDNIIDDTFILSEKYDMLLSDLNNFRSLLK
jgi:hypothetical protein